MNWTPTNKKTGVEYDPVTDAEKTAMEADPQTKGKYTFKVASGDAAPKQAAKPKAEKEKLVPMGVNIPEDQQTEKELPQA